MLVFPYQAFPHVRCDLVVYAVGREGHEVPGENVQLVHRPGGGIGRRGADPGRERRGDLRVDPLALAASAKLPKYLLESAACLDTEGE